MDTAFLASSLRRVDPDRYLASLFAPVRARPALWALYGLNHEIVRTRSTVTDTTLGLIRLQWWRDEISRVYDGGSGGNIPQLSALAPSIHDGTLPFEKFEALLYAREFDLEDVAPATLEGLKNYADFTTTPLYELSLLIAGESAESDEIRRISMNYGLFEAVRSVPDMLAQGRCYLPGDLLSARNLAPKKIIQNNHKGEIAEVVKEIFPLFDSYRKSKSSLLDVYARMTSIYIKRLAKSNFDVFSSGFQAPPPFFALRLALGLR